MLYVYDDKSDQLTHERTNVSLQYAANVLGTTPYKLKKMIEVFTIQGVDGIRMMQHGSGRRPKFLNITEA